MCVSEVHVHIYMCVCVSYTQSCDLNQVLSFNYRSCQMYIVRITSAYMYLIQLTVLLVKLGCQIDPFTYRMFVIYFSFSLFVARQI